MGCRGFYREKDDRQCAGKGLGMGWESIGWTIQFRMRRKRKRGSVLDVN